MMPLERGGVRLIEISARYALDYVSGTERRRKPENQKIQHRDEWNAGFMMV
jgi:hypothetical protein